MELMGPRAGGYYTCMFGAPCILKFTGYGIASHSTIMILANGTCGDMYSRHAVWEGPVTNPTMVYNGTKLRPVGASPATHTSMD